MFDFEEVALELGLLFETEVTPFDSLEFVVTVVVLDNEGLVVTIGLLVDVGVDTRGPPDVLELSFGIGGSFAILFGFKNDNTDAAVSCVITVDVGTVDFEEDFSRSRLLALELRDFDFSFSEWGEEVLNEDNDLCKDLSDLSPLAVELDEALELRDLLLPCNTGEFLPLGPWI